MSISVIPKAAVFTYIFLEIMFFLELCDRLLHLEDPVAGLGNQFPVFIDGILVLLEALFELFFLAHHLFCSGTFLLTISVSQGFPS